MKTLSGLEFDDKLDADGEVNIVDDTGPFSTWINKADAIQIVAHLTRVFELDRIKLPEASKSEGAAMIPRISACACDGAPVVGKASAYYVTNGICSFYLSAKKECVSQSVTCVYQRPLVPTTFKGVDFLVGGPVEPSELVMTEDVTSLTSFTMRAKGVKIPAPRLENVWLKTTHGRAEIRVEFTDQNFGVYVAHPCGHNEVESALLQLAKYVNKVNPDIYDQESHN